ncbi:MAG: hypothetical protein KDA25_01440 [Phycisphaerales bacterium]|nr:hypothetical protein [Phycisphaerales bacterium]
MKSRLLQPRVLALAVSLVLVATHASGGTIHVNGACGNDAWTGASDLCVAPNGPKQHIKTAIAAAASGDVVLIADGVYTGIDNRSAIISKAITVRSANGPDACIVDCEEIGRAYGANNAPGLVTVEGITFRNTAGTGNGSLFRVDHSTMAYINCTFDTHFGSNAPSAISVFAGSTLHMTDCRVFDMTTFGTGLFGHSTNANNPAALTLRDCVFAGNLTGGIGGAVLAVTNVATAIVNCQFIDNDAGPTGGAVVVGNASLANSTFSRNGSQAGALTLYSATIHHCTFSAQRTSDIEQYDAPVSISNSILWNSAADPIDTHYENLTITFSDVQGGWPGSGNIDADPLFVQPGSDDVRLGIGSPCVDAGNVALLPADVLDLDDDGDTTEALPLDADGEPRVQGAGVDMGAYEGEGAVQVPQASEEDIDMGETVVLVPEGVPFNPLVAPAVILTNTSGPDDGTYLVTQLPWNPHPLGGGYTEFAAVLAMSTTMPDGTYLSRPMITFTAADLLGADPTAVVVSGWSESLDTWALGVSLNAQDSPGHDGPVGDRIVSVGPGPWNLSNDIGDHGVYWDPEAGQGFAWANIDVPGEYAAGVPTCLGDCGPGGGNGLVDADDVSSILSHWGDAGGFTVCDLDLDGTVDAADLAMVLANFGPCTPTSLPSSAVPPSRLEYVRWGVVTDDLGGDVDGDGRIDATDLAHVLASWTGDGAGSRGRMRGDLTGDGRVDAADVNRLLGRRRR